MSFRYRYLEDVALADSAFEIHADSWDGLFVGATEAMTKVMVDLDDLRPEHHRQLQVEAATVDDLLYDWLSELVYLKDTDGLLVRSADVKIQAGPLWLAQGTLHADMIDRTRHHFGQDVKAVTYHLFEVTHEGVDYAAKVVLDI